MLMGEHEHNNSVGGDCNANEGQEGWENLGYGAEPDLGASRGGEGGHGEGGAGSGPEDGDCLKFWGDGMTTPEVRDEVGLCEGINEARSSDDGNISGEDCGIGGQFEEQSEAMESALSMGSWMACGGLCTDVTMLSNIGEGWDQATRSDELQQVLDPFVDIPLSVHVAIEYGCCPCC